MLRKVLLVVISFNLVPLRFHHKTMLCCNIQQTQTFISLQKLASDTSKNEVSPNYTMIYANSELENIDYLYSSFLNISGTHTGMQFTQRNQS